MKRIFPTAAVVLIFFSACGRDEIQVYRVPKEIDMPPDSTAEVPSSLHDAHLVWKTPLGWTEQPASDMRMGSFIVKGKNGQTADVSVIPLSGTAGGNLANINRWRQQINLDPLTEAQYKTSAKTISPAGHEMTLVNFVSEGNLIDKKFKKRVLAAIHIRGEKTWFFKMMGEDKTVLEAEKDFLSFLSSLEFHEH